MQLEAARRAFGERAWPTARAAYAEADTLGELPAADLERWGLAAFLTGEFAESDAARERAYTAYADAGDADGASRVAFWLGLTHFFRGRPAQSGGWMGLMRSAQGDGFDQSRWAGYEILNQAMQALHGGRAAGALRLSAQARDVARAFGDADLRVLAGNGHGQALLANGEFAAGLAELDEVMVYATTAAVLPQAVGIVYCAIIANCKECLDVDRSQEWTRVLDEWCAAQPGLVPFQGACVVHRSEMLQLRGDWGPATSQLATLIANPGPNLHTLGEAHYLRGELHRLRGEYAAAEASFRDAHGQGKDPQPGLALLHAAQGRADAAVHALQRSLTEPRPLQLQTRLWQALVDVAIAAGDLLLAREASETLSRLAASSDARYLSAAAAAARGQLELLAGNPAQALVELRAAAEVLLACGAPYEVARCRALLAAAFAASGDGQRARLEREAAAATFEALGARPALDALRGARAGEHGLTARELQILRILATGATNRAIADQLVLSEKTVARHVANIFSKLGVGNRATAAAVAFERGLA